jgi:hypothetical protein
VFLDVDVLQAVLLAFALDVLVDIPPGLAPGIDML